jgi:FMN phosphatase YigB (HAD superfamily)
MKIYLDFDDTILDTGAFIRELQRIFQSAGFTEDEFYDNWKKTKDKSGDFDFDTLFHFFAESGGFDERKVRRSVDTIFSNMDVFVHDDFFGFAEEFGKDRLAILSFGTTPWQREKIENSKIVPYFSEVIVTSRGKEEDFRDIALLHADKRLFFVDDRAHQIDKVKSAVPQVVTMKIERPGSRYRSDRSEFADHIVKDLHEAARIIKNNR